MQPRVGAAVARWPRRRCAMPRVAQVERRSSASPARDGRRRLGVEHLGAEAGGVDVAVDLGRAAGAAARRRRRRWRRGRRRSGRGAPSTPTSRPASATPSGCSVGEVERRGGRAGRRAAATARGGRRPGRRISSMVRSKRADAVEPPEDVHAAVAARQAAVAADGEHDVAAGRGAARRRAARRWPRRRRPARRRRAARRGCGSAVGVDLVRSSGSRPAAIAGTRGPVAPAGGDDDVARPASAPSVGRRRRSRRRRGATRRTALCSSTGAANERGVAVEVGGELGGGHEAVGVGPVVATSRAAGSSSSA